MHEYSLLVASGSMDATNDGKVPLLPLLPSVLSILSSPPRCTEVWGTTPEDFSVWRML
jgi:hypothetical protein